MRRWEKVGREKEERGSSIRKLFTLSMRRWHVAGKPSLPALPVS